MGNPVGKRDGCDLGRPLRKPWAALVPCAQKRQSVATGLQNMAAGLGILDRRAGLGAPHAGCRDPGRATHTASYAVHDLTVQIRLGTDLAAMEPVSLDGLHCPFDSQIFPNVPIHHVAGSRRPAISS